jgi:hypothetical protein
MTYDDNDVSCGEGAMAATAFADDTNPPLVFSGTTREGGCSTRGIFVFFAVAIAVIFVAPPVKKK